MIRTILFAFCVIALQHAASAALIDNLELYYSFDNDTLTPSGINDLSGNNRTGSPFDNNGNANVGLSFSSNVPAAIGSGNSLQFSAIDSIRTDAWTGVTGSGARTISMWVQTTSLLNQVFAEWGTNSNGQRFTFRMESASNQPTAGASIIGGVRTEIQGDYRTTAAASPAINNGSWHHIATVYNPGATQLESVTMYVNGVAVATTDNTATISLNTVAQFNLGIGGPSSGTGGVYNGLIDEFAVWSRALSPAEISQLAAGATVIPEPSSYALLLLAIGIFARKHRSQR
jgi:hypothetical protein